MRGVESRKEGQGAADVEPLSLANLGKKEGGQSWLKGSPGEQPLWPRGRQELHVMRGSLGSAPGTPVVLA